MPIADDMVIIVKQAQMMMMIWSIKRIKDADTGVGTHVNRVPKNTVWYRAGKLKGRV